jgi:hypothetical protein
VHTGRVLREIFTSLETFYPTNAILLTTTLSPHVHREHLCAGAYGVLDHAPTSTAVRERGGTVGQPAWHACRELGWAEKMGRW